MTASNSGLTMAVTDYWKDVDPRADPIVKLALRSLGATYVEEAVHADIVLFSVFGRRNGMAPGTRVGFSGEPRLALGGDWTIDWRHVGARHHLRFPYWAHHMMRYHAEAPTPSLDTVPERFCNFVYSNDRCGMRNAFFTMLDRERGVDAPGRVFHNIDSDALGGRTSPDWPTRKVEYLADYRFTVAFENEEHVGYTTEKLVDAWLAGSVPIYWGNPAVEADFARGSYLSFYEVGSLGALVDEVLAIDDDPARLATIRAANPFVTGELERSVERYVEQLTDFLGLLAEDAMSHRGQSRRSPSSRAAAGLRVSYEQLRRRGLAALTRR